MLDAQGPSSNKWDKAKQQAKDMASQAKAKFNKYKDSDQAKEHVAKGKELMVSDKAKDVAKALGAGVLAAIASGNMGKMMDLNSKADMLNKVDAIAVAERSVSDNAVQVSKNQINNYTNYSGIGQKSMSQTLKEAGQKEMNTQISYQKGVLDNMHQLQNNESNIAAKEGEIKSLESKKASIEADSQDLTSSGNLYAQAIKDANNNTFQGSEFGPDFGQKAEALKSKLVAHDQLKTENQTATDKYYSGNTMNPALEATQQSKDAQGDAAKVILGVGGLTYAISRKKKGEQAPSNEGPKTEPNPEPIPQVPEAQKVETVTEAVQAIEGIETITPPTEAEIAEAIKINEETQESISRVKKGIAGKDTGFTAEEYGPKEAVAEEVVEIPVVKKDVEKVPLWKKAGNFATQAAMLGSVVFAGTKGFEALKGQPQLNMGGANVETVNYTEIPGQKAAEASIHKFEAETGIDKKIVGYFNERASIEDSSYTNFVQTKQSAIEADARRVDPKLDQMVGMSIDTITTSTFERNKTSNLKSIAEEKVKYEAFKAVQNSDAAKNLTTPNNGVIEYIKNNRADIESKLDENGRMQLKQELEAIDSFNKGEFDNIKLDSTPVGSIAEQVAKASGIAPEAKAPEVAPAATTIPAADLAGATQTPPTPNTSPDKVAPAATAAPAKEVYKLKDKVAQVPDYYTTAKNKIDAFAKESGVGEQMRTYTKGLAKEMITNLTAAKEQKGSTMTAEDLSILDAKINAWNYIATHMSNNSVYIPVADSARATFETAAKGNPESIFLKITIAGEYNTADFCEKNFDGAGTFAGSYAQTNGISNARANMDKIQQIRSQ
jgi:hypothetical protein